MRRKWHKTTCQGEEDIKFKRAKIFEAGHEDAGEGGIKGGRATSGYLHLP